MSLLRPGQAEMFAQFLPGLIAWSDVGACKNLQSSGQQGDHPACLLPDLVLLSRVLGTLNILNFLNTLNTVKTLNTLNNTLNTFNTLNTLNTLKTLNTLNTISSVSSPSCLILSRAMSHL